MLRQASKHIALEAESCFTQVRMRQISERQHRGERKKALEMSIYAKPQKGKEKKKKPHLSAAPQSRSVAL